MCDSALLSSQHLAGRRHAKRSSGTAAAESTIADSRSRVNGSSSQRIAIRMAKAALVSRKAAAGAKNGEGDKSKKPEARKRPARAKKRHHG